MKFISPPSKGTSLIFKCKVGITVIWLLLGAVLGYLFLVIAFCLPTNRMRSHLELSLIHISNTVRKMILMASATVQFSMYQMS